MKRLAIPGTALPLALLLLTALSLLAIVAAADGLLQLRMSDNHTAAAATRAAAESALLWGEDWLMSLDGANRPEPCEQDCADGAVIRAIGQYPVDPELQAGSWWLANGLADGQDPASGEQLAPRASPGHWIVEELFYQPSDETHPALSYYRVLARADGAAGGPPAVMESILARPWGEAGWRNAFPDAPGTATFCRSQTVPGPCGRLAWQQRR